MEIDPKDVGFGGDGTAEYHTDQSVSNNTEDERKDVAEVSIDSADESDDRKQSPIPAYHITKLRQFKKYYNDHYVDLFNQTCNADPLLEDKTDLRDTQHGCVTWTSGEKSRLFTALAKLGRHALPQLSDAVETKSPIEILAYLDAVRTAHHDRQLFIPNTKNVSLADIPAAIEIGSECEAALDRAADAVNAYQEHYDTEAGLKATGEAWLIDREAAIRLDVENDAAEFGTEPDRRGGFDEDANQQAKVEISNSQHDSLFKFSTMLDLSEQFFMNHPRDNSDLEWKEIAEPGQRPAITNETAEFLLSLVSDRVRRILRVAVDVAEARSLAMSADGYVPSDKLKQSDITTSLDILNLPHDAWDFWTGLARRNKYQVITGSHDKGDSRQKIVSYDVVEATLAPRRGRGRRRSMSVGSQGSSSAGDLGTDLEPTTDMDGGKSDKNSEDLSDRADALESAADDSRALSDVGEDGLASSSDESGPFETVHATSAITPAARRLLLEEAAEDFADECDKRAQVEEERKLWQILGKRSGPDVKSEEEKKQEPRPKTLRKATEEMRDWSCTYMAEWEMFGRSSPFSLQQAESPIKRPRLDVSEQDESM